jgi:Asp-tRNA(Asn)/Glu-tRNA(Gln) amidotransferase A subunit family amidase
VARELSPFDFARAALERIERLDRNLRAFLTVDPDQVLDQARRAEIAAQDPERCGPLFGVPVSIKDSISTAGLRTTWGSLIYRDTVPCVDDACVARLRAAGAIILGKTNVPEFQMLGRTANRLLGESRNPWDSSRTAGGSSGGSAASVAAGLNALSLGGDDGGSVRLPAAICGLVGYLPTAGRVPRLVRPHGQGYVGWPFQNMGPLARDVGDAALMTELISGFAPADPFGRRDRLELPTRACGAAPAATAAWLTFPEGAANPAVLGAARRFAEGLAEIGLHLAEDAPPFALQHDPALMLGFIGGFLREIITDPAKRALVTPFTESMIAAYELNPPTRDAEAAAYAGHAADLRQVESLLERHDLLLCPTFADLAPVFGDGFDPPIPTMRWAAATAPFNAFGLPAISLPCGFVEGLPIGLQLVGRRGADRLLFETALAIEAHWPWAGRRPLLAEAP